MLLKTRNNLNVDLSTLTIKQRQKNPKNNNQIVYRTNVTNKTNKIVAYHGRCFPLNKIHLKEIEAF